MAPKIEEDDSDDEVLAARVKPETSTPKGETCTLPCRKGLLGIRG
jgi:hypothetical protein